MALQANWRANLNIVSPSQMAAAVKANPQFDWREWDKARYRLRQNNYQEATQKMTDKAVAIRGEVMLSERSLEQLKNEAMQIYSKGANALTPEYVMATASICHSWGLSISPIANHFYIAAFGGAKVILISYQGYLYKALKTREFYHEVRAMNKAEREEYGLKDGDFGAICEISEVRRFKIARELGIEPKPLRGVGIVTAGKAGSATPEGRPTQWRAETRALKDGLRHLGLGDDLTMPDVEGFYFDHKLGGFVPEGQQLNLTDGEREVLEDSALEVQPDPILDPVPEATQPVTPPIVEKPAEPKASRTAFTPDSLKKKLQVSVDQVYADNGDSASEPITTEQQQHIETLLADRFKSAELPDRSTELIAFVWAGVAEVKGMNYAQYIALRNWINKDLAAAALDLKAWEASTQEAQV